MMFTDVKFKGVRKEFKDLEKIMLDLGFVRGSWDYDKAIYDYHFSIDGANYYLRVRGDVVGEKQIEHPKALLELDYPVFVQHFFPHGLDYDAAVPVELEEAVKAKLAEVEKALA
jgi:hypothetical protein